jgi:site-specific recombinase XerD
MMLNYQPKRRREKCMPLTMDGVIGEYLASLKLRDLPPSTVVTYDKVLSHFRDFVRRSQPDDARVPFSAVSLRNARGYVAGKLGQETLYSDHPLHKEREGKLSPHTVHQHVSVLRAFGHWLTKNDYTSTGLENLEPPKLAENLIDILSPEEIDQLYNMYSRNTLVGSRWRATFAFFLQTCARPA